VNISVKEGRTGIAVSVLRWVALVILFVIGVVLVTVGAFVTCVFLIA
jgi:hypothetical protein